MMLSPVNIKDKDQAIIMHLHSKFVICFLHKDYYTNWLADEKLYYMNIEYENILKSINQNIYKNAINNKKNIIGIFDDLEMLK